MSQSPKHNFLKSDLDQSELSDNLIHLPPSEYTPGPTGMRVHRSLARTRILRGGLGSGKTRCATEHANQFCLEYPGAFGFIGRKDITMLKVTTQKEFLEKVVRPETIQGFNVNENKLYYKNGSMILFGDTKVPDDVKSMELAFYLLDETDENPTSEIWEKLDDRLRQKIRINGEWVIPPYCGLLVFNPTPEEHWLCDLSKRTDIDVEDFRFDTFENQKNLPPDYIPNLLRKLPPWEVDRLVHGHWGRKINGKPVIHGFTTEQNVRALVIRPDLPLLRGWDFGHTHPAVSWAQVDPKTGRYCKFREFMGRNMKLFEVVPEVKRITNGLVSPGYPIFDYGDPHGADEKDVGESSIEYLRRHHSIVVLHKRTRIKSGIEEIQEKVLGRSKYFEDPSKQETDRIESNFIVDYSCKTSIAAYLGGYHRDDLGIPVKDGYYDHLVDTDRYIITHQMGATLANRFQQRRYIPRNSYTGY